MNTCFICNLVMGAREQGVIVDGKMAHPHCVLNKKGSKTLAKATSVLAEAGADSYAEKLGRSRTYPSITNTLRGASSHLVREGRLDAHSELCCVGREIGIILD